MEKGIILLTSTGLSCRVVSEKITDLFSGKPKASVAIVTTAAEGKENNKYSQLAKQQFIELGFEDIDFIDLEIQPNTDFSRYGIVYVCGGNTFTLLKFVNESSFKTSVQSLLSRGGVYIGVSAGSIILSPSIAIAGEIEPDVNEVGIEDLNGLHIVGNIVLPHYSPEIESEVKKFENKYNVRVDRLNNDEFLGIE